MANINHLIATGPKKNIARRVKNTVKEVYNERVNVSFMELFIRTQKSIFLFSFCLRLERILSMITIVSDTE
jgi:hypothetical protein